MTTISPNRRRGGNSARLRSIIVSVVFICIVAVLLLLRNPIAGLVWRVAGPLSQARNSLQASTGNFFSIFSPQASLVAQNNALRAALASSTILALDRNILYSENIQLKSRLNRNADLSSTLAVVLSRPPATPYDTLMIDVGKNDGVAVGDMVSPGGSVYIGTITQVYPTTSRVLLFSAPGQSYEALLMSASTHTTTPVSVSGQGSAGLMAEVPAGTQVAVGDSVVFPNITPHFVASVVSVESKEEESFKTIFMQLPVNPLTLEYVEVRHP